MDTTQTIPVGTTSTSSRYNAGTMVIEQFHLASNVRPRVTTPNGAVALVRRHWTRPATPTYDVFEVTTRGATIQSRLPGSGPANNHDELYPDSQHFVQWATGPGADTRDWVGNRYRYTLLGQGDVDASTQTSDHTFRFQAVGQTGHGGWSDTVTTNTITLAELGVGVSGTRVSTRSAEITSALTNGHAAAWQHSVWAVNTGGPFQGQYERSNGSTFNYGTGERNPAWRNTITPAATGNRVEYVYSTFPGHRHDGCETFTPMVGGVTHCRGVADIGAAANPRVAGRTVFDALTHDTPHSGTVYNTDGFNTVRVGWSRTTAELLTQVSGTLGCNPYDIPGRFTQNDGGYAVTRSVLSTGTTSRSDDGSTDALPGDVWTRQVGIAQELETYWPDLAPTGWANNRVAHNCASDLGDNATHTQLTIATDGHNQVQHELEITTPQIRGAVAHVHGERTTRETHVTGTVTPATPVQAAGNGSVTPGWDATDHQGVHQLVAGTSPRLTDLNPAQIPFRSGLTYANTIDGHGDAQQIASAVIFTDGRNSREYAGATIRTDMVRCTPEFRLTGNLGTRAVEFRVLVGADSAGTNTPQEWVYARRVNIAGTGAGQTAWTDVPLTPPGDANAGWTRNNTRTTNADQTLQTVCTDNLTAGSNDRQMASITHRTLLLDGTVTCAPRREAGHMPTRQLYSTATPLPANQGAAIVAGSHTIAGGASGSEQAWQDEANTNFGFASDAGMMPRNQAQTIWHNDLSNPGGGQTYTCTAQFSDGFNNVIVRNTQGSVDAFTCAITLTRDSARPSRQLNWTAVSGMNHGVGHVHSTTNMGVTPGQGAGSRDPLTEDTNYWINPVLTDGLNTATSRCQQNTNTQRLTCSIDASATGSAGNSGTSGSRVAIPTGTREVTIHSSSTTVPGAWISQARIGGTAVGTSSGYRNPLAHCSAHTVSVTVTDGHNSPSNRCDGAVSTACVPTPSAPTCGTPGPNAWMGRTTTVSASNTESATTQTVTCPNSASFTGQTASDGHSTVRAASTSCSPSCTALPAGMNASPGCSYGGGVSCSTATCPTCPSGSTCTAWSLSSGGANLHLGVRMPFRTLNGVTIYSQYWRCTAYGTFTRTQTAPSSTVVVNGRRITTPGRTTYPTCSRGSVGSTAADFACSGYDGHYYTF